MFELSIKDTIASAHYIPGYPGMCKDLHGHTWKIEVVIVGKKLDKIGMVTDFFQLKKKLKEFLKAIDHVCLNDLSYFKKHPPTTEHIAKYIYDHFQKEIPPLKLKYVQVWESENSSVTYFP